MRVFLAGVAVILTCGDVVAVTCDDVVAAAYPPELSVIAAQRHYSDQREQAYTRIAVAGVRYIIAAYSNGHVAAVALIDGSVNPPVTKQLIRDHQTGTHPSVTAVDLDGDDRPEVVVTFALGPRGAAETWVYRIQGGQLVSIGPMDEQGHTLLGDPDVVDFNGNGVMDLVDLSNVGDSSEDPVTISEHYVLQKGVFVAAEPLDFYELFFRGKTGPVTKQETFAIAADALRKPYRLTIINGGFNGNGYRSSAASVSLNGATVSSPGDFSQQHRSWSVPVNLQTSNSLAVRLEGQPNSRIIVAIRHD